MTKSAAMAKLTAWVQQNPETHIGDMTYYFIVGSVSSTGDPKSALKWPPGIDRRG